MFCVCVWSLRCALSYQIVPFQSEDGPVLPLIDASQRLTAHIVALSQAASVSSTAQLYCYLSSTHTRTFSSFQTSLLTGCQHLSLRYGSTSRICQLSVAQVTDFYGCHSSRNDCSSSMACQCFLSILFYCAVFLAHKKRQVVNSDIWKICIVCTKIAYFSSTTFFFLSGRCLIQNKCASSSTIFVVVFNCFTQLLLCCWDSSPDQTAFGDIRGPQSHYTTQFCFRQTHIPLLPLDKCKSRTKLE